MIDHALALTHIDERGAARMVDVSEKPVTLRVAKASGLVIMKPSTLRMISDGAAAKGDVMAAARIAGIAAAKRTGRSYSAMPPVRARRCQRHYHAVRA